MLASIPNDDTSDTAMSATHGGKGDSPRPVNMEKYAEGYERAFGGKRERIEVTQELREELEQVRDIAFNSKWPKPRFYWESLPAKDLSFAMWESLCLEAHERGAGRNLRGFPLIPSHPQSPPLA